MTATFSELTAFEAKVHPRYRFVIAALILAANISIGLNFFSVTPLLPLVIDDYEITRASASLLIALPTIVKAFVGIPGSLIINRFGLHRSITLSWFMIGLPGTIALGARSAQHAIAAPRLRLGSGSDDDSQRISHHAVVPLAGKYQLSTRSCL